jgi:hypothetical protein
VDAGAHDARRRRATRFVELHLEHERAAVDPRVQRDEALGYARGSMGTLKPGSKARPRRTASRNNALELGA